MNEPLYAFWWSWVLSASGQLLLFVPLVGLLAFLLRNASARLRYGLWTLVLLKALLPPLYTVPAPLGSQAARPPVEATISNVLATWDAATVPSNETESETVRLVSSEMPSSVPPFAPAAIPSTQEGLQARIARLDAELARPDLPGYVPRLFAVWLAGLGLFAAFRLVRYVFALRMLARARELHAGPIYESYRRLAATLRLRKPPRLFLADRAKVPFLFGLLRARIVLPATLPEEIAPSELDDVLLHELMHFRRWDLLLNWAEFPVQGLFWFHPLVLWAIAALRHEREAACDEAVLASGATEARNYGRSLLNTLWAVRGRTARTLGFLGIFERNTYIQQRLENIMQQQDRVKTNGRFGTLFLLLFATVFVPLSIAQDQNAEEKAKRKAELREQIAALQGQLAELEATEQPTLEKLEAELSELKTRINDFDSAFLEVVQGKSREEIQNLATANLKAASELWRKTAEIAPPKSDLLLKAKVVYGMAFGCARAEAEPEVLTTASQQVAAGRDSVPAQAAAPKPDEQLAVAYNIYSIADLGDFKAVWSELKLVFETLLPESHISPSFENSSLIVIATENEHKRIAKFLETTRNLQAQRNGQTQQAEVPSQTMYKVYQLRHVSASEIGEILSKLPLYPTMQFVWENSTNSVIVQGSEKDQQIAEALILKLDRKADEPATAGYAAAAPPAAPGSEKVNAEIEKSLQRQAEFAERLYEQTKQAYDLGAKNGTAWAEAQTRYAKFQARQRLLHWQLEHASDPEAKKTHLTELREAFKQKIQAGEDWNSAAQAGYDVGRLEIDAVLAAQKELEEARIRQLKFSLENGE